MKPSTLILRTAGTNCDRETAYAFELAGSVAQCVHINSLLKNSARLDAFQIIAIPGGFSYGDDIAAGRIFANQIRSHLAEVLGRFVSAGKPIIGICNGFQVLVKAGLLPGNLDPSSQNSNAKNNSVAVQTAAQTATLAHNDSGRFIAKWIHLAPKPSPCIWTTDLPLVFDLPIAHGEGRFVAADPGALAALHRANQIVLLYANADGSPANGAEPANPNGSTDDIAGICDPTGLVFGLMPHPERYVNPRQHPAWSSQRPLPETGAGLTFFQNAVRHVRDAVGAGV